MNTYLSLANTAKSEIKNYHIEALLKLAKEDERVGFIEQDSSAPTPSFIVKAVELDEGVYTLGAIANHLNQLPSERRKKIQSEKLPDVINITDFMDYGIRSESDIRHLPRLTRAKVAELSESLEPSHAKAQCINILNYKLYGNETIAERFCRDHYSLVNARRHAQMLVEVGCANEINRRKHYYGTVVFEDGSSI